MSLFMENVSACLLSAMISIRFYFFVINQSVILYSLCSPIFFMQMSTNNHHHSIHTHTIHKNDRIDVLFPAKLICNHLLLGLCSLALSMRLFSKKLMYLTIPPHASSYKHTVSSGFILTPQFIRENLTHTHSYFFSYAVNLYTISLHAHCQHHIIQ